MPPSRLRVLQVIDSLFPGGAERLIPVLLNEFAKAGEVDSVVRVLGSGDNADPTLERQIRASGADFGFTGSKSLYDPELVRSIVRTVRRHRIDVVHSHLSLANVGSRLACAILRIPHVSTVHSPPDKHHEDAARRVWADGLTARLSTRVVGVSPHTATLYARQFRVPARQMRVILNGTAPRPTSPGFDRARKRRELLGRDGDARIVLAAGRLEERKGFAVLMEAAAGLSRRVDDLKVLIAGKGPDEPRLRALVEELGVHGTVELIGFRDDIGDLLASVEVVCLPSYIEGLPVSLLESMHAGTPCVATAVGGTTAVIRDEVTGLLVPAGDAARLESALERVLTDRALADRLSAQAREEVLRSFTPDAMAGAYASLYREVIASGRRG